jgi:hypothetical protein
VPRGWTYWRSRLAGVALGLIGAAAVLAFVGHRGPAGVPRGPVLSDCDGPLRELVVHYTLGAAPVTGPIFTEFLRQLPEGIDVHVVCPDRAAYDDLAGRVGTSRCRLLPVIVGHEITGWSRDRWLAARPAESGGPHVLLLPRSEMGGEVWPARLGDQRVGEDLARNLGPDVACVRSDLLFDGGDFVTDGETAFVAPGVLTRNLHMTVDTSEQLGRRLDELAGRKAVLLNDAPDHHAGMFMMTAGERTVVVGDAAAGRRFWDAMDPAQQEAAYPQTPDFSDATRDRFDSVARACEAAGYRVVRTPVVAGTDSRTYLTYVNVIIDQRAGRRVVYMPVYRGVDEMNRAAREAWEGVGYEVRTVDCTAAMPHFGSLRCLVSVLRRGE